MRKKYVTYHRIGLDFKRTNLKAIECCDLNECRDTAMDIASVSGIRNVRINRSGRLPKGTTVITQEEYRNGSYINK